ncbi:hypothetical protein Bhyg_06682, partial [Pseudolycoriella hygida]
TTNVYGPNDSGHTLVSLASISSVFAISVHLNHHFAVPSISETQPHLPSEVYMQSNSEVTRQTLGQPEILLRIPQVLPSHQNYDFYLPPSMDSGAKYDPNYSFLQDMQPPPVEQEPNYYEEKLKKGTKKYSAEEKHVNYKNPVKTEKVKKVKVAVIPHNFPVKDNAYAVESSKNYVTQRSERLTPLASMKIIRQGDMNTGEYLPEKKQENVQARQSNGGNDKHPETGGRVEYQMHGFNGPNSYKFGYDTGKGQNRQFRIEQRDKDGNVEGQYGFYDKNGRFNVIKYTSKLNEGFKAEKAQIV